MLSRKLRHMPSQPSLLFRGFCVSTERTSRFSTFQESLAARLRDAGGEGEFSRLPGTRTSYCWSWTCFSRDRRYVSSLVVLSKVDLVNEQYLAAAKKQIGGDFVPISAEKGLNMDLLAERIWGTLNFIRIYLKRPDGDADFEKPLILPAG